jgi:hypothetical protein
MWDEQRQQPQKRLRADRLPSFRSIHVLSLTALTVLLGMTGCNNQKQELLENEMRARDFQYRDLLDCMKKTEFHNQELQNEIQALRSGSKITPELAAQNFGLKRIVLGFLTMGVNSGNAPGDDLLQVIVEPHDVNEDTIKVPGSMQITAQEVSAQGIKTLISTWDISQDQVRKSWKQGMFGTGYYFKLPWQNRPQYENVRVTVRFVLSDHREFQADKDVKVRLAPRDMLPKPQPLPEEPPLAKRESNRSPFDASMKNSPPRNPSRWQPAPLGDAIELDRPEALD